MRRETVRYVIIILVFLSAFALPIAPGHAETEPFYVQASRAHVRATPVIEPGNILDTLERGTDVAVLGQTGEWYEVQLPDGRTGWMHQSVLGVAPPPAEVLTAAEGATRLPLVRVGIVLDGPSPQHAELLALFENEIRQVLKGDRTVQFPKDAALEADWTASGVKKAMEQLLGDPGVDVVLALGMLGSHDAGRRQRLPKPVFAPFVLNPQLQGIPLENGTSGRSNLYYLAPPTDLAASLRLLYDIKPFTRFAVLVPQAILALIPDPQKRLDLIIEQTGLELQGSITPVGTTAAPALQALPPNIEAVIVTAMPQLPEVEFDALIAGINQQKLPSVTTEGRRAVERGLLVTRYRDVDRQRLARRVALSMLNTLVEGENPSTFRVLLPRQERLTFNMATARAIDIAPPWDFLTQADLLHAEDIKAATRTLSLETVVREAIQANLDLQAANRFVAAGQQTVKEAQSFLLPQVDAVGDASIIDEGSAEAGGGSLPEKQVLGALVLNQILYDEPTWANFSIQQDIQVGREEERNISALDVMFEAAVSYLNVLAAKTAERIQRQNLDLTRANLELARVRRDVGEARPAEVVRWENQIANDRRRVISAFAQTRQSEIALNRVLHQPLEASFRTEEPALDDPQFLSSFARTFPYVDNPRFFEIFRDYMVQEGLEAAPELRLSESQLRAQERQLRADKRAFWLPTFALRANVATVDRSGVGSDATTIDVGGGQAVTVPQDNDWSWEVGASASLPLFTGFGRMARVNRSRETLAQLQFEREATAERIATRIRTSLYESGASFANIDLAREAARAADRNYDLVLDGYREGVVSILDLLDAQTEALNANLDAANSVYLYLIDLMAVQRSVGQFDFFLSQEGRRQWFNKLDAFFQEQGAEIPQKQ
jgi:outer membrane protein